MIIEFYFAETHRISDWTFNIKQGWETHTKGLSQILPNKSRWTLPFLRSQKFLEIFVPVSEITFLSHFDKLTGNLRVFYFWRSQIERKYNCFVYNVLFYQIIFIISLRGRFFLLPENTRFNPVIFQIEAVKIISIFAGSFSPLLTFVKSSDFSLEHQDIPKC